MKHFLKHYSKIWTLGVIALAFIASLFTGKPGFLNEKPFITLRTLDVAEASHGDSNNSSNSSSGGAPSGDGGLGGGHGGSTAGISSGNGLGPR